RRPVNLAGEERAGLENLARLLRLRGADRRRLLVSLAWNAGLAAGEVEGDDLAAEVRQSSHGAAGTGLGVVGVAAHHDYLEGVRVGLLLRLGLRRRRQREGKGGAD